MSEDDAVPLPKVLPMESCYGSHLQDGPPGPRPGAPWPWNGVGGGAYEVHTSVRLRPSEMAGVPGRPSDDPSINQSA